MHGTCYALGLPPALDLGKWITACLSTPIGSNCTATCPDKYQPGSSGPPTVACTVDAVRGLTWSAPAGSCELIAVPPLEPLQCVDRPAAPKNGAWSCGASTPDGGTCQGTYHPGLTGTPSVRCSNGAWGSTQGACTAVQPPQNPGVENLGLTDCGTPGRDVTATKVLLRQKDDAWATYSPLPFDLISYDMAYTSLGVNSNGYVTFGPPDAQATPCASSVLWSNPAPGLCVPTMGGAAAVFFDDLLCDSVLAYESSNAEDLTNPYTTIQYTMATFPPAFHPDWSVPDLLVQERVMGPDFPHLGRTYNTFSFKKESLKAGMALLFKAQGSNGEGGYIDATTWTDAAKYVKFVQNPGAPPRPVIISQLPTQLSKSQT
ncbi:hypothetical protein OEZ86_013153 [Tetradesmus obliquus]|nr:hypothetical protein OEZ86_013153 [Tetradesmus obliquus]